MIWCLCKTKETITIGKTLPYISSYLRDGVPVTGTCIVHGLGGSYEAKVTLKEYLVVAVK